MPLLGNNREVVFKSPPRGLKPSAKVFHIRFTGEIFADYSEYLERMDFYRVKQFSCCLTGKSRLSYEQALAEEDAVRDDLKENFPELCYPSLLRVVHFSTDTLSALTNAVFEALKPVCAAASVRQPLKKTIKAVVRICAEKDKWTGAPWIVASEFLTRYSVDKKAPDEIVKLLQRRAEKQQSSRRRRADATAAKSRGKKKVKGKSKSLSTSKAGSPSVAVSLKYPCKDEYLVIHSKVPPFELRRYDSFFRKLTIIGCGNPRANDMWHNASTSEFSDDPLMLFNSLNAFESTENSSESATVSSEPRPSIGTDDILMNDAILVAPTTTVPMPLTGTSMLNSKRGAMLATLTTPVIAMPAMSGVLPPVAALCIEERAEYNELNRVFSDVWRIWSFLNVFSLPLQLSPFPVCDLIAALFHDRKCVVLDEVFKVLLEALRQCAHPSMAVASSSGSRAGGGLRRSRRVMRSSKVNYKEDSETETETETEEEEEESDEEDSATDEEEEEDEFEEESAEAASATDSSEDSEKEDGDDGDEDSAMDCALKTERTRLEAELRTSPSVMEAGSGARGHPAFNEEPLTSFRVDVLRDLILYECERRKTKLKLADLTQAIAKVSVSDSSVEVSVISAAMSVVSSTHSSPSKAALRRTRSKFGSAINAPKNEALALTNATVIAAVQSPRAFYALDFWDKLDILQFLFGAVMRSEKMADFVKFQVIEKKSALKQLNAEEQSIQSWIREKRKELKSDRDAIKVQKDQLKAMLKEAGTSITTMAATSTVATSDSTATSEETSAIAVSTEESREMDALRIELAQMEMDYKEKRESVNAAHESKLKVLESTRGRLLQGCRVSLTPLGCDRLYRRYFWDNHTSGRIFVLCPFSTHFADLHSFSTEQTINELREKSLKLAAIKVTQVKGDSLLPQTEDVSMCDASLSGDSKMDGSSENGDEDENEDVEMKTEEAMDSETKAEAKRELRKIEALVSCINPWDLELITSGLSLESGADVGDGNSALIGCWQIISTTEQFHELLRVLDGRGLREKKLLFTLNALKEDIKASMRAEHRDNYAPAIEKVETGELEMPLRRSKRPKRSKANASASLASAASRSRLIGDASAQFLLYKNTFAHM